eukprot:3502718-Rhodomonas_salina.1
MTRRQVVPVSLEARAECRCRSPKKNATPGRIAARDDESGHRAAARAGAEAERASALPPTELCARLVASTSSSSPSPTTSSTEPLTTKYISLAGPEVRNRNSSGANET